MNINLILIFHLHNNLQSEIESSNLQKFQKIILF
jgi:hypothetical protein